MRLQDRGSDNGTYVSRAGEVVRVDGGETFELANHDRIPGGGVSINSSKIAGAGVFIVSELPAWIFCEDHVRRLLVSNGFTNVTFLEAGSIA